MSAEEIVGGLIKGPAAIDQMKKEVEQVVRMILGLVKLEMTENFVGEKYESESCFWMIIRPRNGATEIGCWVKTSAGKVCAYSTEKAAPFPSSTAQQVHEGLPLFVEGVMKAFPKIGKHWQFILNAAGKCN